MGMTDDMDMSAMRARYDELRSRDMSGNLEDKDRSELDRLRPYFE
jgi:hypothetical protein